MTAHEPSFLTRTAGEIMTRDLARIPETMTMREAAQALSEAQVSGAPVVDDQGRCVGVISASDFVRLAGAGDKPTTSLPTTCGFQIRAVDRNGARVPHCRLPFGACAFQRKEDGRREEDAVLCAEPHCVPTDWQVVRVEHLPGDAVARHMNTDLVATGTGAKVQELARHMLDAHIHRILVLDDARRPVGIVSSTDILAALAYGTRPVVAVGG